MLASTGVDAKAGVAGAVAPEFEVPFFWRLDLLAALMSDMIQKEMQVCNLKLHWTIVLNVLSHHSQKQEENEEIEQNTLKSSKKGRFCPLSS